MPLIIQNVVHRLKKKACEPSVLAQHQGQPDVPLDEFEERQFKGPIVRRSDQELEMLRRFNIWMWQTFRDDPQSHLYHELKDASPQQRRKIIFGGCERYGHAIAKTSQSFQDDPHYQQFQEALARAEEKRQFKDDELEGSTQTSREDHQRSRDNER